MVTFIHNRDISKLLLGAAFAVIILLGAAPADAQRFVGTRNSFIGTAAGTRNSRVSRNFNQNFAQGFGLRFSTLGLFGDADPFVFSSRRRPIPINPLADVLPLPINGRLGNEFLNVTFDQYLQERAGRFDFADVDQYKDKLLQKNVFNFLNNQPFLFFYKSLAEEFNSLDNFNLLLPDAQAAILQIFNDRAFGRVHELDFLSGGGELLPGDITSGLSLLDLTLVAEGNLSLPTLERLGDEFVDQTFDQYKQDRALLFDFDDDQYKGGFLEANPSLFSQFDDLVDWVNRVDLNNPALNFNPKLNTEEVFLDNLNRIAFDRLHEKDFLAGGGVLPPIDNRGLSLVEIQQIAGDAADDTDNTPTDQAESLSLPSASASQSLSQPAASLAVPEPATLGLIALGASALLGRSRRR